MGDTFYIHYLFLSLLLSSNRIKTNMRVTFECIIIVAESIRLILIQVYEFAFDHLIMMLSVFLWRAC